MRIVLMLILVLCVLLLGCTTLDVGQNHYRSFHPFTNVTLDMSLDTSGTYHFTFNRDSSPAQAIIVDTTGKVLQYATATGVK